MGAMSRRKGSRAEAELVAILRAAGWPHARRVFDSGSAGGGDVEGPAGVHLEVKRCERLQVLAWCRQAESEARSTDVPVVAFRTSGEPWRAVLPLDELLALLRLREA